MNNEQLLNERRAVNFFDPGYVIEGDTLKKVITLANLAPSSLNLQPWELLVVRSLEKKKVLRKIAFGQPKVEEASAVLVVIADNEGVEKNMEPVLDSWVKLGYFPEENKGQMRGMAEKLYGNKMSVQRKVFAVKNASLFAMNLMVAARVYDLETHPMDGFDAEALKKEFAIAGDKEIPMIIAIGRKRDGADLLPRAYRRDISDFVSFV